MSWSEMVIFASELLDFGEDDEAIIEKLMDEFLVDKWTAGDVIEDARR